MRGLIQSRIDQYRDDGLVGGYLYTKGIAEIEKEFRVSFIPRFVELFPVTYTKNEQLLNMSIIKEDIDEKKQVIDGKNVIKTEGKLNVNTEFIGRFKRENWQYQSEWRYYAFLQPLEAQEKNNEGAFLKGSIKESLQKMKKTLREMELPMTYFDLPVNEKLFSQMEILCGPLTTTEDIEIVKELVEKYNPTASVTESKLLIRK